MTNIEDTIKAIEKDLDFEGVLKSMDEIDKPDVIPFNIPSVDAITGIGGVPRGMITEIYGNESSAKTSLCLNLVKSAQDLGLKALFIDAEMAMNREFAQRFGVDTKQLVMARPAHGEEAFELISAMSEQGYGLIVIDSVSSLVPNYEVVEDFDKQTIGLQARMMSKGMRHIVGKIMKNNTAVVFINQVRENINTMGFGDKTTTSGGRALKFYSAIRMQLARTGWLKKGTDKIGMSVKALTKKNKLSTPMREANVDFLFASGWDILGDQINRMLDSGEFELIGRTYYKNGEKIGNRDAASEYIKFK
jgi:recombination protein RecA